MLKSPKHLSTLFPQLIVAICEPFFPLSHLYISVFQSWLQFLSRSQAQPVSIVTAKTPQAAHDSLAHGSFTELLRKHRRWPNRQWNVIEYCTKKISFRENRRGNSCMILGQGSRGNSEQRGGYAATSQTPPIFVARTKVFVYALKSLLPATNLKSMLYNSMAETA